MDDEKWVEVARTGTFSDSMGRPQTFTTNDLDAIVAGYAPSSRQAPLVFGHPEKDNGPAYGWVDQLKRHGQTLLARFAHVPANVRELVAQKHYRHVSLSFMPDRVTLRHVALLGAAQPANDGLRDVELAGECGCSIAFTQAPPNPKEGEQPMNLEELQRQIGQLQAQLEQVKAENELLKKSQEDAAKGQTEAETAKTKAEEGAAAVAAEFSAYKGQVEADRRAGRVAALVQAGKVTPAEKAGILNFAATLAGQGGTVDFAAVDGSKETVSLEERYLRELEARPEDGRFATNFSAPPAHAGAPAPTYDPAAMVAKL